MSCPRVRRLFGAYWDDEITQAEREWIESHFAACPACRDEYEAFSRTIELVSSLPRQEASPDLVERVTSRARRSVASADRLPAPRVAWVPVTAAAALAVLALATAAPWLHVGAKLRGVEPPGGAPVAMSRPSATEPAGREAASPPRQPVRRVAAGSAVAAMADSLFDHSEDVEFILDPVTVRRGHVRPVTPHAVSVQGERAVITF